MAIYIVYLLAIMYTNFLTRYKSYSTIAFQNYKNHLYIRSKLLKSNILRNISKLSIKDNISSNYIKENNILALDFDGVICASSKESSISSIIGSNQEWIDICNIKKDSNEFYLISSIISDIRPIVETGYENMLLVRYLYESYKDYLEPLVSYDDKDIELWKNAITLYLLNNWNHIMRDSLLLKYNATKTNLIESFGKTRDQIIKEQYQYWIDLNTVYSLVLSCLKKISLSPLTNKNDANHIEGLYIITTKQERFVKAILENNGLYLINNGLSNNNKSKIDTSSSNNSSYASNIFDLDNIYGSKINVLKQITIQHILKYNTLPVIHFIEDRYETLLAVIEYNKQIEMQNSLNNTNNNNNVQSYDNKLISLKHVQLYLADWGYNTLNQKLEANKNNQIKIINQNQFEILVNDLYNLHK